MTQAQTNKTRGWQPYKLDHYAQTLVLQNRDAKDILNESHKMRMSVAYGLERFWGEHLRLGREKPAKGKYWKSVWDTLEEILQNADLVLPNDDLNWGDTNKIQAMATKIWSMPIEQQRIALIVLTQLCDALVWWTQRYKIKSSDNSDN
ncbi:MAG: hypothetical protein HC874_25925 [Richelia sp. SL_2_1]|nr:hypothetical protein [Richelia sp. SM1_7_0]NJN11452.1 hypothetical protein [Richelia sp. RM1_1_1]NJO30594.1 hypothetical protein [Richelia sp. SL_2_1]